MVSNGLLHFSRISGTEALLSCELVKAERIIDS